MSEFQKEWEEMKSTVRILSIGFLCLAAAMLILNYYGEHRVWGYEIQIDGNAAGVASGR